MLLPTSKLEPRQCRTFEGRGLVVVGSSNGFQPISDVLWRSIPRPAAQFFQLVETRSTLSDVGEKVCLMNLPESFRKFQ